MGGNSNFARPMPPTYRGCTVLENLLGSIRYNKFHFVVTNLTYYCEVG